MTESTVYAKINGAVCVFVSASTQNMGLQTMGYPEMLQTFPGKYYTLLRNLARIFYLYFFTKSPPSHGIKVWESENLFQKCGIKCSNTA